MAKRIVSSCDNKQAHPDELVDATEVVVAVNSRPMGLDLCPDCHKALIGPLVDLLAESGQPLGQGYKLPSTAPKALGDAPPAPAAPIPVPARWSPPETKPAKGHRALHDRTACPAPRCSWEGTRMALDHHAKSRHGGPASVLEGRYGRILPDGSRVTLPLRCQEPGCEAAFSDGRGMTQHLLRIHQKK